MAIRPIERSTDARFPDDSEAVARAFEWLAQVEDSLAQEGLVETVHARPEE